MARLYRHPGIALLGLHEAKLIFSQMLSGFAFFHPKESENPFI
jgi:hypothetical protein